MYWNGRKGSGKHTDSQLISSHLLHFLGERSLVAWSDVWMLLLMVTARGNVKNIDSLLRQDLSNLDSVLALPRLLDPFRLLEPVRCADADEKGHVFGKLGTSEFDNLNQEPSSILEASSVLVCSLVGYR